MKATNSLYNMNDFKFQDQLMQTIFKLWIFSCTYVRVTDIFNKLTCSIDHAKWK